MPILALRLAGHLLASATGVTLVILPFLVLQFVGELWLVVLLAAHARGQHELSSTRATVAAVTPIAFLVLLGVASVLVFASAMDPVVFGAGLRGLVGG